MCLHGELIKSIKLWFHRFVLNTYSPISFYNHLFLFSIKYDRFVHLFGTREKNNKSTWQNVWRGKKIYHQPGTFEILKLFSDRFRAVSICSTNGINIQFNRFYLIWNATMPLKYRLKLRHILLLLNDRYLLNDSIRKRRIHSVTIICVL